MIFPSPHGSSSSSQRCLESRLDFRSCHYKNDDSKLNIPDDKYDNILLHPKDIRSMSFEFNNNSDNYSFKMSLMYISYE